MFADRLIAFDHVEEATYVVCLTDAAHRAEARRWVRNTRRRLDTLPPLPELAAPRARERVEFRLSRSYEQYVEDIRRIQEHLVEGETYEVCLTNRLTTDVAPDPLATLPAPSGA